MLLVIDNYDSFVHNLARFFRCLGQETLVRRSDQLELAEIRDMSPDAIVLSPGPKTPDTAGCCVDIVQQFAGELPMLGVCLGHQVIAQACGGRIIESEPVHGIPSLIHHRGDGLFEGLPNPFRAGRYHSLVADAKATPDNLMVTAWTNDDLGNRIAMGIEHRRYPIVGVQFHPESILTEYGDSLLRNFLRMAGISPEAST